VWANAAFQAKVIEIAKASRPAVSAQSGDDEIPF
jgi:hypothetical protein